MTLEEAIKHCEEKACDNTECALEHRQLAEWLQELQQYRKNARNQITGIEEAAEKYANRGISSNSDPYEETIAYRADKDAFKAGAEWMAEQGITVNGTFHHSCGYPSVIELKTYLRDYEGADVTVQIRKKE